MLSKTEFDGKLMKVFSKGIDAITVMEDVISGKEYQQLVLFDCKVDVISDISSFYCLSNKMLAYSCFRLKK